MDEGFTINFIETNFAERVALEQHLADKERPDPKVLTAFVPQLLDEFSSRMWSGAFRASSHPVCGAERSASTAGRKAI